MESKRGHGAEASSPLPAMPPSPVVPPLPVVSPFRALPPHATAKPKSAKAMRVLKYVTTIAPSKRRTAPYMGRAGAFQSSTRGISEDGRLGILP
jgi:hypothetical protein